MGTRGIFGFRYKGKYYVCYNHFDSYPSELAKNLIEEIKSEKSLTNWIKMLKKLKIVDESIPPTQQEIISLNQYHQCHCPSVGKVSWYSLLRNTQGSFVRVLESGHLLNHIDKDEKPCFEEFGYILNFDTMGFEYYHCDKWIASFSVDNLPNCEMLRQLIMISESKEDNVEEELDDD